MRIAYLLTAWRHHEHLSVREAAERVGIPPSTLLGIEKGGAMSSESLVVIRRWMLESDSLC
jgi:transcriptional regulator with XRE-family HTH domain